MTASRAWWLSACLLGLALLAPPAADATFPGQNGKIFFTAHAVVGGLEQGGLDVWSVNPDGSGLINLTDLPGGPGEGAQPSVSGDGTRVAFTVGSQATSEIWVMNSDGSNPHRLTNDNLLDQTPAFSPDGSRIAWGRWSPFPTYVVRDIWVMNADGTSPRALITTGHQDVLPDFTPDGQTIVYANETGGTNFDLATAPSSGGPFSTAAPIATTAPATELLPSVSPDGARVAFRQAPAGGLTQSDVVSTDLNGASAQPIATDPGISETAPAYSPDGAKIAFITSAGGGDLIIANVSGTAAAPAALSANVVGAPSDTDWAVKPVEALPVDVSPPETTIDKSPKRKTEKTKAKFRFSSSEPDSSFECKFDRRDFAPCASPRKYKHLKPKRHKFKVRATDAAGNTDPSPAKAKFRVVTSS